MIAPNESLDAPVVAPWTGFEPDLLARLALAPVWSFSMAQVALIDGETPDENLGLVLDSLAQAGLIDIRSTIDRLGWQVTIQPAERSLNRPTVSEQVSLPEHASSSIADSSSVRAAVRIGLLASSEVSGDSNIFTESTPRKPDLPDLAGETDRSAAGAEFPFTLRLADVQLRACGFRFRSPVALRQGQRLTVTFVRNIGIEAENVPISATVIATRRDDWSGRSAVVMFDATQESEIEFPAGALYAEFNLAPRLLKPMIAVLRRQGSGLVREARALPGAFTIVAPIIAMPEIAQRWCELGRESNPSRRLEAELKPLLVAGQTSEAELWLAAGQRLALALGGPLETAVLLGQRRLELAYRRLVDQRLLECFVKRQELTDAFEKLLGGEQGPWALHYLGVGGVGKTMLVRYLTATYAEKLPVSRVDFDFLSPDYPVRRPGQLLLELGDGLRSFGAERSDDVFQKFQDQVTTLHAALEASPPSGDELASLDDSRFQSAFETFCDFLRTLLGQPSRSIELPRVVLILDTCEELARLRADGEFQPAVAATFTILERLHERVPAVRVVFAGRRLLANRGADWEANEAVLRELPVEKRRQRPAPDYLRLKMVRGFTRDEAVELLQRLKAPKPGARRPAMNDALAEAIMSASPEAPPALRIRWDADPAVSETKRFNPFLLALYADWFLEEPELEAATIASGKTDPYVEKRILGRLQRRELAVLPHLVLLRRVDEPLLRKALADFNDEEFDNLFRELCQLEWISYSTAELGGAGRVFIEVERQLRPRIELILNVDRKLDLKSARADLVPLLRESVLAADGNEALPTSKLVIEHLEAALRLLPATEAERVWALVEMRVAEEGAWPWARQVCDRLLAPDETSFEEPHTSPPLPATVVPRTVRAQVRATHIAALLRLEPERVTVTSWEDVSFDASECVDETLRDTIAFRARIGVVTANARQGYASEGGTFLELAECVKWMPQPHTDPLRKFHQEQIAASLLAAVDAVLEMAESHPSFADLFRAMTVSAHLFEPPEFGGALPEALHLPQWLAQTRWRRLTQNSSESASSSGEAIVLARRFTAPPPWNAELALGRDPWLDWPQSDKQIEQMRFETLRELLLGGPHHMAQEAEEREMARTEIGLVLGTADLDGLAALVFQWRLARTVIPRAVLEDATVTAGLFEPIVPTRVSHRSTPPFFVVLADAWLAYGEAARALRLLYEGRSRASSDLGSVQFAQAMRLKIVRRMRLENEAMELLAEKVDTSGSVNLIERWSPLDRGGEAKELEEIVTENLVLALPTLRLTARPGSQAERLLEATLGDRTSFLGGLTGDAPRACAWWRAQELVTPDGRARATKEGQTVFGRITKDTQTAWSILFAIEHRLLEQQPSGDTIDPAAAFQRELENIGAELKPDWRQRLYLGAMRGSVNWGDVKGEAEVREAAEWAFEEGELLALRWPIAGARLLGFAREQFAKSGDAVGRFLAATRVLIAHLDARRGMDVSTIRSDVIAELKPAYEALMTSAPRFPGSTVWWEKLSNEKKGQEIFADESARPDPDWIGWLERFQRALEYFHRSFVAGDGFAFWKESVDGAKAPLEMRSWLPLQPPPAPAPAPQAALAPQPASVTEPSPAPRSGGLFNRLSKVLANIAGWSFAVGIVGGIVVSPAFAILFVRDLWKGGGSLASDWKNWVLVPIGWLVLALPILLAFQRLRSWQASRSELLLRITNDSAELLHARISRPWLGLIFPRWSISRVRESLLYPVRIAWQDRPHPPILSNVAKQLSEARRRLGKSFVPLAIDCAPPLAHEPWEERLFGSFHVTNDRPWPKIRPYRLGMPSPQPMSTSVLDRTAVLLMSSPTWQSMLDSAWHPARLRAMAVLDDWFQIEALVEWPRQVRVLHLMGRPVEHSPGFALKIEVTTEFLERDSYASPSGVLPRKSEKARRREEVLVTPGRRGMEDIPLLIVQAEPSSINEITETDRRESLRLRTFCGEMFTAGASAVLMIPSLPPELSQRVIEVLARHAGRLLRRMDLRAWLTLADAARNEIATWRPSASAAEAGPLPSDESRLAVQRELALNVTLFARHQFQHLPRLDQPSS